MIVYNFFPMVVIKKAYKGMYVCVCGVGWVMDPYTVEQQPFLAYNIWTHLVVRQ